MQNDKMKVDLNSRMIGVRKKIESFDFFFGLNISYRVYSHTDKLSRTLQDQNMSACSSKRAAELTLGVLQKQRDEQSFASFYASVLKKFQCFNFIQQPVHPRKRRAPDYSILQFADGCNSVQEAFNPGTFCDRYQVMYYEAMKYVLLSIKYRFNQTSYVAYENIETLLLKPTSSKEIYDEMKYIKEVYDGEINGAQFMREADLLQLLFDKEENLTFLMTY